MNRACCIARHHIHMLHLLHTVPVTFVDYYRADYPVTPPATLPEHYQFYFVFLRENLFDDSSSDVRDR